MKRKKKAFILLSGSIIMRFGKLKYGKFFIEHE